LVCDANQIGIICPNCKRSLPNINSYHYCKEVSIDDIFAKKSDEVILVFDKLLQHLAHVQDVEMSATKNCIVFVRNKTFLVVKPMTKCLQIKFYATAHIDDADYINADYGAINMKAFYA
jgi:hypothetical protein